MHQPQHNHQNKGNNVKQSDLKKMHQPQSNYQNRGSSVKGLDSQSSRNKKRKNAFIYGNYHAYYGYRINPNSDGDPRLKLFKKEWFEGKDCLDIGCNEGIITISIAQKFGCQSILGVDIDSILIGKARRNLKSIADGHDPLEKSKKGNENPAKLQKLSDEKTSEINSTKEKNCVNEEHENLMNSDFNEMQKTPCDSHDDKEIDKSDGSREDNTSNCVNVQEEEPMNTDSSELQNPSCDSHNGKVFDKNAESQEEKNAESRKDKNVDGAPSSGEAEIREADRQSCLQKKSVSSELISRVTFRNENFVQDSDLHGEMKYDTVLCLSVTKWVHLNWGDKGLIHLFAKMWRVLKPGGILILEPQPWKSYESKRLVSDVCTQNFQNITYKPNDFRIILLDKIGFRTMERIGSKVPNSTAGFDRPIYLLQK